MRESLRHVLPAAQQYVLADHRAMRRNGFHKGQEGRVEKQHFVFRVVEDIGELLRMQARIALCRTAPLPDTPKYASRCRWLFHASDATRPPCVTPSCASAQASCRDRFAASRNVYRCSAPLVSRDTISVLPNWRSACSSSDETGRGRSIIDPNMTSSFLLRPWQTGITEPVTARPCIRGIPRGRTCRTRGRCPTACSRRTVQAG